MVYSSCCALLCCWDSVLCCCFSQTVLRIWDCLFYEGSKILFRVALTLIHHNQDLIQQSQSLPDVCQSFKKITHGPFVEECHTFMQVKTPTTLKNHHESFYGMKDEILLFLFSNPLIPVSLAFPRKSSLNQEVSPWQPWLSSGQPVALVSLLKNPDLSLLLKFSTHSSRCLHLFLLKLSHCDAVHTVSVKQTRSSVNMWLIFLGLCCMKLCSLVNISFCLNMKFCTLVKKMLSKCSGVMSCTLYIAGRTCLLYFTLKSIKSIYSDCSIK